MHRFAIGSAVFGASVHPTYFSHFRLFSPLVSLD